MRVSLAILTLVVAAFVGATPARAADPFYSDDISFVSSDAITVVGGQRFTVDVVVTNTSSSTWPTGTEDSVFGIARIYDKHGRAVVKRSAQLWTYLYPSMVPGETRTVGFVVDTFYPLRRGTYILRADLVRGPTSSPTFFGSFGNPTPQRVLNVS